MATQEKVQAKGNQQPLQQVTTPPIPYDSNPFTLSFRGFGLLLEYARGVTIALIIFGFLSLGASMVSNVLDTYQTNQPNTTQNESFEDLFNNYQDDATEVPAQTLADNTEGQFDFDTNAVTDTVPTPDSGQIAMIAFVVLGIIIVVTLIALLFGTLFEAAYRGTIAAGAVAASRHETISFGSALSAMANRFGTLWWALILAALRIIGGLLVFIVPGIRAGLRYEALPYVIMANPSLGAKEALEKTKALYNGHLMEMFGIVTVESIIPVIGEAIGAGGKALSYQQIQAYSDAGLQTPKTHWLNYIGLVFAALFVLMILALLALFAAFATNGFS